MEEKTDLELIQLALQGDKEAFGELVVRYQMPAIRFARRLISDDGCTEELVQESFLQAYLSLDRLRSPERFRGWLFGIVLNVCRSYLRDQKLNYFSIEAMSGGLQLDAVQFLGGQVNPAETAEENELHQKLLDAVNSLPAKDREITLNFYYDQLSLSEIAALQGISIGAAKVRLMRARQHLKAVLLTQYPDVVPYKNRRKKMIEVTIADVIKQQNMHVIILKDEAGKRLLPIWVGAFEGQSIAIGLSSYSTPRPLTFYFFSSLLKAIKAKIERVRIETLKEDTFYSVVEIRCGSSIAEVDARPSDALALAAINGIPVVAADAVMEKAGISYPESAKYSGDMTGAREIVQYFKDTLVPQLYRPLSTEERRKVKEEFMAALFPNK